MENIVVQKTKQGIDSMLVELKAQRAFHEQAWAQISKTIATLEAAAKSIGAVGSAPAVKKPAVKSPAKKTAKPAGAPKPAAKKPAAAKPAAKKTAAAKTAAPKPAAQKATAAKTAAKTAAPKTAAAAKPVAKPVAKKTAAPKAAKKGTPKSTAARLAAMGTAKLDPTTAVAAAGFSPRIVKFCKSAGIETVADLAKHDLRQIASTAARIGEGAIVEMLAAVKRAGLKPYEATKPNGVPAPTAAHA